MFNYIYTFGYSSKYNIGLYPVIELGPVSNASQTRIAHDVELVYDDVSSVQSLASDRAETLNLPNLSVLLQKMHALVGFECVDMPTHCSMLTIDGETVVAYERSNAKGRIPKPKLSTKVPLFAINEDDMFVVFSHDGRLQIAQLPGSHVFNKLFQPSVHPNLQQGWFHRAFEFNMHLHTLNDDALTNQFVLLQNIEAACQQVAMEVWKGEAPHVFIEPNLPKYSGYGFNITIISEDPHSLSNRCFPEEAFKKHLALQTGELIGVPSLEIFNVIAV